MAPLQGRQTVGAPGTRAGQSVACQSSWGRGAAWPAGQNGGFPELRAPGLPAVLSSPCATERQQGRCCAQHSVRFKEANQTQGWEQSVQPAAMCTGGRTATLPQENAPSPRAPQDTHWPQGSADTVAAGRTGDMTHSENRSSRLGETYGSGFRQHCSSSCVCLIKEKPYPAPMGRAGRCEGWQGRGMPESRGTCAAGQQ